MFRPQGVRGAAHSMTASAQVTAPGATASMIAAVSTEPNRQNRSTCSRMSVPLAWLEILKPWAAAKMQLWFPSLLLQRSDRLRQLNFSTIAAFRGNHFNRLATSGRTNFCRLARTCYDIVPWGLECVPVQVVEQRTLAAGYGQIRCLQTRGSGLLARSCCLLFPFFFPLQPRACFGAQ